MPCNRSITALDRHLGLQPQTEFRKEGDRRCEVRRTVMSTSTGRKPAFVVSARTNRGQDLSTMAKAAPRVFSRTAIAQIAAGPGGRLADVVFDRCKLETPWLYTRASVFVEAERLVFDHCRVRGRGLSKVICRDVRIEGGFKSDPLIRVTNSMFDRVTFVGDFGGWFFCWLPDHLTADELARYERFYAEVPFAIDVRRARFKDITLRGIPGHLVLRDPATSILVRRATLERDASWQDAKELGIWPDLFRLFLKGSPGLASQVFVANVLSKRGDKDLAVFERLRKEGWAE